MQQRRRKEDDGGAAAGVKGAPPSSSSSSSSLPSGQGQGQPAKRAKVKFDESMSKEQRKEQRKILNRTKRAEKAKKRRQQKKQRTEIQRKRIAEFEKDSEGYRYQADEDAELKALRTEKQRYAEQRRALIASFTQEQELRYEAFRRSRFDHSLIGKLLGKEGKRLFGSNADKTKTVFIVLGALAKVHVGEIIEHALDVQKERGGTGPVTPDLIREALRRIKNTGVLPPTQYNFDRLLDQ